MDDQDYPIRHFEQMVSLANALRAWPAQILEHRYYYETMGTWVTVLRYRGVPIKLAFDGREGEVQLQRSASRKPPYDWHDAGRAAVDSPENLSAEQLFAAVREIVRA